MVDGATGQQRLGDWVAALAARRPVPGGGGATAVVAGIAQALAAMAAVYSTGKAQGERAAAHDALARNLTEAARACLGEADADAAAFAALQRGQRDAALAPERLAQLVADARAVPLRLIAGIRHQIAALQAFLPHCNPHIVSDAKAALHLLAGAGRAAAQLVLVNEPRDEDQALLATLRAELAAADRAAG